MKTSIIQNQNKRTRIQNPKQIKKIKENPRILEETLIKTGKPSNKGIQARILTPG